MTDDDTPEMSKEAWAEFRAAVAETLREIHARENWDGLEAEHREAIRDGLAERDSDACLDVTFGLSIKDGEYSWGYQTGDNSFTGGAYGHPNWSVVSLSRDTDCDELAEEVIAQYDDVVWD